MEPSTFGELLQQRAVALSLVNAKNAADAGALAAYLAARKITATQRGVEAYFRGERAPRIGRMELILDALDVHGDARLLAYRLAARIEMEHSDEPAPLEGVPSVTS